VKREELRYVCELCRQHGYEMATKNIESANMEASWRSLLKDANKTIRELQGLSERDIPLEER